MINRRDFVKTTVFAGAAVRTAIAGRVPPSDQVNIAIVGVKGRGNGLAGAFADLPEANIAYLCDVDEKVFDRTVATVEKRKGKRPRLVGDLRRVFDDKAVDAVVIATPDHWHAPATILACEAGKDVYVEKPCSHNLREGRLMVEAARRNKRVVQHGTQARSRPAILRAMEYIRAGKLGQTLAAKAWNVQMRDDIGRTPDSAVPPGVDYDIWTGPAPLLPFNENRFHYKWHWHWNYGTGDVGNDGAHQIDMARWALGVDYPVEVSGMGCKLFFQDDQQTPDTVNLTFRYPGKGEQRDKALIFEMRIWNPYGMEGQSNGVAVYGSEGVMHLNRTGFEVFDGKGQLVLRDDKNEPNTHAQNFVDCVRSRRSPNAEIETGHLSSLHCHLGNIVARTGRSLKFDPRTETIIGDAEASRYLRREYRQHWAAPKGV